MDTQNTYSLAQVAEASDSTETQIRNWLKRYAVRADGDQDFIGGGGEHGRRLLFSRYSVTQFAVAAELLRWGMADAQQAFSAAMVFSHVGDSIPPKGFHDDAFSVDLTPREPSGLFPDEAGETFPAVRAGKAAVVLIGPDEGALNAWDRMRRELMPNAQSWDVPGIVVLHLRPIVERIDRLIAAKAA